MCHVRTRINELLTANPNLTDKEIIAQFDTWRDKGFAQLELQGLKRRSKSQSAGSQNVTTTSDRDEKK